MWICMRVCGVCGVFVLRESSWRNSFTDARRNVMVILAVVLIYIHIHMRAFVCTWICVHRI